MEIIAKFYEWMLNPSTKSWKILLVIFFVSALLTGAIMYVDNIMHDKCEKCNKKLPMENTKQFNYCPYCGFYLK